MSRYSRDGKLKLKIFINIRCLEYFKKLHEDEERTVSISVGMAALAKAQHILYDNNNTTTILHYYYLKIVLCKQLTNLERCD